MTTLLVANRGEIALRIFRTAKRMGMRTVAVYSDADTDAPHVRAADVRKRIGPAPAGESYLRRDRILEAAREAGAELVHPGYGFLAEDDRFAKDCEDLGYAFVGPPSDVLRRVGDKAAAKALAVDAGVPVLPAYAGEDQTDDAFLRAVGDIGLPVVVKSSGGGGGKGMAVVRERGELAAALASARRIALAAFDDDRLILERYLEAAVHIEVQILADTHGNVVHLGERDCSLQRRHQKILEESPAPNLDADIRGQLHRSAVAFARHAGYVGAGTCEFVVGQSEVGFIEMNARLQVEHPVTEMVTGLDLVELQLGVAMGQPLPIAQGDVRAGGHAIEVRVYAEAPDEDFLPQAGRVEHVRWPENARVDTGIEEETVVSPHYDPLLAKIVVRGHNRVAALWALHRALPRAELLGVRTNLTFLNSVSQDPVVIDGRVTTDWLETAYTTKRTPSDGSAAELALVVAAAGEAERILARGRELDPWTRMGPWRAGAEGKIRIVLRPGGNERVVTVEGTDPFTVDDRWKVGRGRGCHEWWVVTPGSGGDPPNPPATSEAAARGDDVWFVWVMGAAHEIPVGIAQRRLAAAGPSRLDSPLPGQVIAVRVEAGQRVAEGEELVVVEAMKMEHAIKAPGEGTVRAVLCEAGDQVERGQPLVDFEPREPAPDTPSW